jgi:aromatic ring-cleaving dioxygenase
VAVGDAPFHAHIYYSAEERPSAERLRDDFASRPEILFVGQMTDRGVGPHPIPQYEVHFREGARPAVLEAIEASGLRALVHPLSDDDLADHTSLAHWIGEPVALDASVLDPPGVNQSVPRFGKSDF